MFTIKNFINLLSYVLKDQAGNFEIGDPTDYSNDEFLNGDSDDSDTTDNSESDSTQSEGQAENAEELTVEQQLDAMENGEPVASEGGDKGLLDLVNSLGLIDNGLPFELENEESIRETIMKGHNYTQKTMAHADAVKAWEESRTAQESEFSQEREAFEAERSGHHELLQENRIIGEILPQIKENYPDVFQEITQAYQQSMNLYKQAIDNPLLQKQNERMSALEKQLEAKNSQENESAKERIRSEWDSGLGEVQTKWGAKLKTLGISPKWADVQNTWQSDASQKMTVQGALMSLYGDQIAKGLSSQKRLATTKANSTARQGTRSGSQSTEPKKSVYRGDEYMQALNAFADKL